jgi:hypothetical protein
VPGLFFIWDPRGTCFCSRSVLELTQFTTKRSRKFALTRFYLKLNSFIYNKLLLYVIVAWCLIKHRKIFIFFSILDRRRNLVVDILNVMMMKSTALPLYGSKNNLIQLSEFSMFQPHLSLINSYNLRSNINYISLFANHPNCKCRINAYVLLILSDEENIV